MTEFFSERLFNQLVTRPNTIEVTLMPTLTFLLLLKMFVFTQLTQLEWSSRLGSEAARAISNTPEQISRTKITLGHSFWQHSRQQQMTPFSLFLALRNAV